MPFFPPLDAQSIAGTPVDRSAIADGLALTYHASTGKIIYASPAGGSGNVRYKGAWSSSTEFVANDLVIVPSLANQLFVCLTSNTNSQPPSVNWQVLASNACAGADQQFVSVSLDGTIGPSGFDDASFLHIDGSQPMLGDIKLNSHSITATGSIVGSLFAHPSYIPPSVTFADSNLGIAAGSDADVGDHSMTIDGSGGIAIFGTMTVHDGISLAGSELDGNDGSGFGGGSWNLDGGTITNVASITGNTAIFTNLTGTSITGDGSAITNINAANISSGTLSNARAPAVTKIVSQVNFGGF